jgi:4-amino-4-deoxy-L-arabinose transferase-like glycosyltransferase
VFALGVAAVAIAQPVFLHSVTSGLSDEYDEIALNLVHHGRFSAHPTDPSRETIMRGPVYPLYLAGLFRLFGTESLRVVGFADMGLHALTAALLVLALRMFVPPWIAAAGGLVFALWPTTFYYAGKGSSETMLTLWMVASFLLLLRLGREPSVPAAIGLGIAIGLACLTRGSAVALLMLAMVWVGILVVRRSAGRAVAIALVLAWTATMAPWWTRNAALTGAFVPFHSLVWYNAYHDDRFDAAHRWLAETGRTRVDWGDVPPDAYPSTVPVHPQGSVYPSALAAREDLVQEARYRDLVLAKAAEPGYLPGKFARNAVDFWSASASVRKSRALLVSSLLWLGLLGLALRWAWPERSWRAALASALAVVALTWVLYLPFLAIFRHSIPTAPFVAFAIGLGLAGWTERRAARRVRAARAARPRSTPGGVAEERQAT